MILDGTTYYEHDAFMAAVAKLPPRSRLNWNSGCIVFREIQIGSAPPMSIPAFKAFCRSHRIRFDYQCGLPADPLLTKSFSVPRSFAAAHKDPRQWLESQGVAFPSNSFARWGITKKRLIVRNSVQELELTATIIELSSTE